MFYSTDEKPISFGVKKKTKNSPKNPLNCYKQNLRVSKSKYNDLKKLCKDGIIPEKYHLEYNNIVPDDEKPDSLID